MLSTHERFEKREDEDDGREKLRTSGDAVEGANSRKGWGAAGLFAGGLCGHAAFESMG